MAVPPFNKVLNTIIPLIEMHIECTYLDLVVAQTHF